MEQKLSDGSGAAVDDIARWSQRIGEVIAQIDEKELRWLELDEIIGG